MTELLLMIISIIIPPAFALLLFKLEYTLKQKRCTQQIEGEIIREKQYIKSINEFGQEYRTDAHGHKLEYTGNNKEPGDIIEDIQELKYTINSKEVIVDIHSKYKVGDRLKLRVNPNIPREFMVER